MDATDKTDAAWHWREAGNGGGGCYPEHPEAGEKGFILARCPKEEHDAGLCPEMQGDTYETTMAQDAAGDFNLEIRVMDERDPYLMLADNESMLEAIESYAGLEANACLICGAILVTLFVVQWTVCEKLEEEGEDDLWEALMLRTPRRPARGQRGRALVGRGRDPMEEWRQG